MTGDLAGRIAVLHAIAPVIDGRAYAVSVTPHSVTVQGRVSEGVLDIARDLGLARDDGEWWMFSARGPFDHWTGVVRGAAVRLVIDVDTNDPPAPSEVRRMAD